MSGHKSYTNSKMTLYYFYCILLQYWLQELQRQIIITIIWIISPISKEKFEISGPGSSVGIATDYGLDGPGSNPGGDEIFRPSRPALGTAQPPVQWVPGLSRRQRWPGRGADPHPHLVPKVLEKSRAIPLLTLRVCVAHENGKNLPNLQQAPWRLPNAETRRSSKLQQVAELNVYCVTQLHGKCRTQTSGNYTYHLV